jgi:hypothetical protein
MMQIAADQVIGFSGDGEATISILPMAAMS